MTFRINIQNRGTHTEHIIKLMTFSDKDNAPTTWKHKQNVIQVWLSTLRGRSIQSYNNTHHFKTFKRNLFYSKHLGDEPEYRLTVAGYWIGKIYNLSTYNWSGRQEYE